MAEIAEHEGVIVETKTYSLALHYRESGGMTRSSLRRLLAREMATHPSYRRLVTVVVGKKVLEIVPRASWDKGSAALHIIDRLGGTYLPVCIGDDATDESLFEAFRERGITVRVGASQRTAAKYYVKSPREVSLLLKVIADACGLPSSSYQETSEALLSN